MAYGQVTLAERSREISSDEPIQYLDGWPFKLATSTVSNLWAISKSQSLVNNNMLKQ